MTSLDEMLTKLEAELKVAELEAQDTRQLAAKAQLRVDNRLAAIRALRAIISEADGGGSSLTAHAKLVVSGTASLDPSAPLLPGEKRSGMRRDVLELVTGSGKTWTITDLAAECGRRGWTLHMRHPESALRHTADRLVQSGHLLRPAPSTYAAPPR